MYVFLFVVVATRHDLFKALSLNQLEILYATIRRLFFHVKSFLKHKDKIWVQLKESGACEYSVNI